MFKRTVVGILALFSSTVAIAAGPAEPQPGLWWNPDESGRGYAIDTQGELLVVTTFAYDNAGRMQWYISSGSVSNGGTHFSAPLLKYDFGQPLNGTYQFPAASGNDGTLTLDFSSRVTGTLTLNGRAIPIQRQNFGVGQPPNALLGQWLFAYSIGGSTFADRFHYTSVGGATSDGTGVVVDTANIGAAEYQRTGIFAGNVVGFQYTSGGTVINQYIWQLQMEEGRGNWVSPLTFNQYGMNVYKTATAAGTNKAAQLSADLQAKGGLRMDPTAVTIDELSAASPEMGALARQMWQELTSARMR